MNVTTPALLFPAISLLMLAYTNRFLGLASLIRNLQAEHQKNPAAKLLAQIKNIRLRINLIKFMQLFGVFSIMACAFSMFFIFIHQSFFGAAFFGISLILFLLSLVFSTIEIQFSVDALNIHLSDLEHNNRH